MKQLLYISALIFYTTTLLAQSEQPEIEIDELKAHVEYLASDELQGRKAGSESGRLAAEYIRDQFKLAGLELLGEDGFQFYQLVTDVRPGENNTLQIAGKDYLPKEDFMPFPFSQNGKLSAGLCFVGYGFVIQNDSLQWDDYRGIDVKDKWVMILAAEPEPENDNSPFVDFSDTRDKILIAKDHGAAGVFVVSGPSIEPKDKLVKLYYDKTQSNAGIPVINIKRGVADTLLKEKSTSIALLEKEFSELLSPNSFELSAQPEAEVDIIREKVQDQNVIGLIEGSDPVLKNRFVIIGAHYDHLGLGGPGSGSRMPDTIAVHNGADDNASGVATIIEMAEKMAAGIPPKRSVLVLAFGAEEMGLIGSSYFTKNPILALNNADAMLNFDMIGRMDNEKKSVAIGGTGTSSEAIGILDAYEDEFGLNFSYSPEGYGPSDHAAFYAENLPVLFVSTGAHADYHTPADDALLINYNGQKLISDFAFSLLNNLANRPAALTFKEAGPKKKVGYRNKLKVTLGIMPDFTSESKEGLGVGGVTKDRPAEKGGMKKGDIIVAIDGLPVGDIYDYMNRLKKLELGQVVSVDVMRNGEKKVLIIQL
jgi:peptidase M28-like protein/PDZ domain-containing protein